VFFDVAQRIKLVIYAEFDNKGQGAVGNYTVRTPKKPVAAGFTNSRTKLLIGVFLFRTEKDS
ncbi:MAG: hypothetical protein Q8911_13980, partial [Bacillota bacterium]|nr:hypothetical protein [Bacillota bacterium]